MCGRYHIDEDTYLSAERLSADADRILSADTRPRDINPTDFAPILTASDTKMLLHNCRFGFQKNGSGSPVINARVETVEEKPMFRRGMRERRAVVPAAHFYEWNRLKEKNVFRREDHGTLYFAGLWNADAQFVILTTAANESMKVVHDRMPLILEAGQVEDWLFDYRAAVELLRQVPVRLFREAEFEQLSLF